MRIFYSLITKSIKVLMKVFLRLEIIHPERLEDVKGSIIAANHISNFDPPFVGSVLLNESYFLAKAELFKFKPFGNVLRYLNSISVKRGQADISAIKKCIRILNEGNSLLIFPQGTRKGRVPKAGIGMMVLLVKKDVVPFYVKNSDKLLSVLFFKRRLKIVIGEKIPYDLFLTWPQDKENYQRVADYIFEKINELSHEAD